MMILNSISCVVIVLWGVWSILYCDKDLGFISKLIFAYVSINALGVAAGGFQNPDTWANSSMLTEIHQNIGVAILLVRQTLLSYRVG